MLPLNVSKQMELIASCLLFNIINSFFLD